MEGITGNSFSMKLQHVVLEGSPSGEDFVTKVTMAKTLFRIGNGQLMSFMEE